MNDNNFKTQDETKALAQSHYVVGVALHDIGCFPEAFLEKKCAVKLDEDNATYYRSVAQTLREMAKSIKKEPDLELEAAVRKITDQNEYSRLYRELCVLAKNEQYDAAIKIQKYLLSKRPESSIYHSTLGELFEKKGLNCDALNEMRCAIKLYPKEAAYHYKLSVILYKLKQYDEALREIQTVIKTDEFSALYHAHCGVIYCALNMYEHALLEERRALLLDEYNAQYYENIATILEVRSRETVASPCPKYCLSTFSTRLTGASSL